MLRPEVLSRWRGERGRLEVWYATFSEPDGAGWWLHYERVAPQTGEAFVHGWAAHFPAAGGAQLERFGPAPLPAAPAEGELLAAADCVLGAARMSGRAGTLSWDLQIEDGPPPLYTFPRWAWERQLLPGAQILDRPGARFVGRVSGADARQRDIAAHGACAHIFSHGSAARWGWLHAELGGGDVLEIVAAQTHLPGGRLLGPRPFARLRVAELGEGDLPARNLVPALRGRARLRFPDWSAALDLGGGRRLRAAVRLDPARCVQLEYPNPDGTSAYCVNSERARAHVEMLDRDGTLLREWQLADTAHTEMGAAAPVPGVALSSFRPG